MFRSHHVRWWPLVCIFAVPMFGFAPSGVNSAVPASEREALVDLFTTCAGHHWVHKQGWLDGDPCDNEWFGVQCGRDSAGLDTIVGLNLNPRGAFNRLNCELPESLGNLSNVRKLYFSNALFPSHITGSVPSSLQNLGELRCFYASHCYLSGPFPAFFAQMPKMQGLYFRHNSLDGVIPDFSKLGDLRSLWLDDNKKLTGSFESLRGLTKLHTVTGYLNKFGGSVPENMCDIKHCNLGKSYLPWLRDTDSFECPLPRANCCEIGSCDSSSRTTVSMAGASLAERRKVLEEILQYRFADDDLCHNKTREELSFEFGILQQENIPDNWIDLMHWD